MNKKKWNAKAPSNIALIKYMGKKDERLNIPDNPSLSYTLPHLLTKVELEMTDDLTDSWESLNYGECFKLELKLKESQRYLKHFKFIKEKFNIKKNFIVRSANSFPENCGLASSASSFAALTKISVKAFSEINNISIPNINEIADLSRQGSGSSCRSFFSPWCVWNNEMVSEIVFPQKNLLHMVVIADGARKKMPSSKAHKNVKSSLLYSGREERAKIRMKLLLDALRFNNWREAFELCWSEFWDMHVLFQTSNPSFGYMNKGSMQILQHIKSSWRKAGDGPIVTMDAGPNVHLLFRAEQFFMAKKIKDYYLDFGFKVYSDKI